jgi:PHD/YefM family antitoxin component YafN of YafNO toxin-antitoxin module
MTNDIQYISNNNGEISGVVLPIDFWNKINCTDETEYLLQNKVNKKRLIESLNRDEEVSKDEAYERLGF